MDYSSTLLIMYFVAAVGKINYCWTMECVVQDYVHNQGRVRSNERALVHLCILCSLEQHFAVIITVVIGTQKLPVYIVIEYKVPSF